MDSIKGKKLLWASLCTQGLLLRTLCRKIICNESVGVTRSDIALGCIVCVVAATDVGTLPAQGRKVPCVSWQCRLGRSGQGSSLEVSSS